MIRLVESQFFKLKLRRASAHERAELMRNQFYFLGKNVELYTLSFGTEPYLISIHDNVICAHDVDFVNHDVSVFNAAQYLGLRRDDIDKVGSIELFENCFVGARTILMPNSSVGKNSIVAAGSIVTKHIPDNLLAELKNRLKISIFLWRKKLCISLIFSNFVVSNYKVIYFTLCTTCMQIS